MKARKKVNAQVTPARDEATGSPPGVAGRSLRQRAGTALWEGAAQAPEHFEELLPEATRRMLHELRVHQIELETRNEALRRVQVELDATRGALVRQPLSRFIRSEDADQTASGEPGHGTFEIYLPRRGGD